MKLCHSCASLFWQKLDILFHMVCIRWIFCAIETHFAPSGYFTVRMHVTKTFMQIDIVARTVITNLRVGFTSLFIHCFSPRLAECKQIICIRSHWLVRTQSENGFSPETHPSLWAHPRLLSAWPQPRTPRWGNIFIQVCNNYLLKLISRLIHRLQSSRGLRQWFNWTESMWV